MRRWFSLMRWSIAVALAVVILDQLTKALVLSAFELHESVAVVPGFFNLCRVHNPGAAWGIFHGMRVFLVAFAGLSLVLFLFFHHRLFGEHPVIRILSGVLVGGIAGNLIDRVRLGYVVDFLDFHWREAYHFPAFNVADMAITGGIFLLVVTQLIVDRRAKSGETA